MISIDLKQVANITGLDFETERPINSSIMEPAGTLVRIRPCAEKYGGKTYLGILLGDVNIPCSVEKKDSRLVIHYMDNPAIYVFELKEVILGMESWWGTINSKDIQQIKDLTNDEINNGVVMKLIKIIIENQKQPRGEP